MSLVILRDNGESLIFDSVISEEYSPSLTVTVHPVEGKMNSSDHAQINQLVFSANCLITESPLAESGGGFTVIEQALAFLKAIETELVTIVSTKLGAKSSMIVTSYAHSVTAAGNLPVNIRAVEISTATSSSVKIPATQPTVTHKTGAPDKTDKGQQAGTEVKTSILASLYDYAALK